MTKPDLDQETFIASVARRFVARSDMPEDAGGCARQVVTGYLESEGIRFGDPEYGWDEAAAHIIADEEMSYWEQG